MMARNRINVSTGASLALALVFTLGVAGPWAPMPPQVREMCGEPTVADASLCNVEEGLHDAFLLIERVIDEDDVDVPNGVSAMVRHRLVSVEWYPNPDLAPLRPGLMGMYDGSSHRVFLPQWLRAEPLRVRASVMAHELGHAALLFRDVGADLRPSEACLQNEARAYKVGMIVYGRARHMVDEPVGAAHSVDRQLADEVDMWHQFSGGDTLTASGLEDLANRHIFLHGYSVDCNWR